MNTKEIKVPFSAYLPYLSYFVVTIIFYFTYNKTGITQWIMPFLVFHLFAILEMFLPWREENLSKEMEEAYAKDKFFDYIMYIGFILIWVNMYLTFNFLSTNWDKLTTLEFLGSVINCAVSVVPFLVSCGHELGHRTGKIEDFMSGGALLAMLMMQFRSEHNNTHHKYVATPLDPATARKGENVYFFTLRYMFQERFDFWKHEQERIKNLNKPWFYNKTYFHVLMYVIYFGVLYILFGMPGIYAALVFGLFFSYLMGLLNYIEHYGLERKKMPNGQYERINIMHSWNSGHFLTRALTWELCRHSDHHYITSRQYQILRDYKGTPQTRRGGYAGLVLLAAFPPLWFFVMNPLVEEVRKKTGFYNPNYLPDPKYLPTVENFNEFYGESLKKA